VLVERIHSVLLHHRIHQPLSSGWFNWLHSVFTVWRVMQRTVLLSQFCPSVHHSVCLWVCQMHVLWQN